LARRLTARLERLAAAAGRVAGGEQGLQLPVRGKDEAARLTESFNRMSTALDQRFAARVEAERALERANEQLEVRVRERTAELEQARNAAEQASRAKSEFLSRMSHELRTPLNAILGFAQLLRLRNGHTSPEVGVQLGHIETAGWHLLALINDVLDLSRIEAGSLAIDVREVAIAPIVAESLRMVQAAAAASEVSIHDGTGMLDAVTVQGDPTRLRQVLVNLLSNACKYNRRGGTVTVDARRDDGWLELAIVDTGPGLDAGQIAALFEPFNRLGMERSGVEGTGIGLVITRRLVELMGGGLDVQSRPGTGSRFAVRLRVGGRGAA
jgi:signal transduction histidine kinase